MQDPIWVGSLDDIRHGKAALEAIKKQSDAARWVDGQGILSVDKDRWDAAQRFERQGWMKAWAHDSDDRSSEHYQLFDQYKSVPINLGNILEVGCGPFTQTKTILSGRTANSITLQDPLINDYLNHRHCSYSSRLLHKIPVTLVPKMLEEYTPHQEFDTVICINVLEHTMDVNACLQRMLDALNPNGIIIFGERIYDDFDPNRLYCVGHPIRICKAIVDKFKKNFEILFERTDNGYFIGTKLNGLL